MTNNKAKRQLFFEKHYAAQPVTLTNLNPTSWGVAFFNANTGSKLEDAQTIDFKYQERQPTSLSDLETMTAGGLHNVVATFKWVDSSP